MASKFKKNILLALIIIIVVGGSFVIIPNTVKADLSGVPLEIITYFETHGGVAATARSVSSGPEQFGSCGNIITGSLIGCIQAGMAWIAVIIMIIWSKILAI